VSGGPGRDGSLGRDLFTCRSGRREPTPTVAILRIPDWRRGALLLATDGSGVNMIARSANGVIDVNIFPRHAGFRQCESGGPSSCWQTR